MNKWERRRQAAAAAFLKRRTNSFPISADQKSLLRHRRQTGGFLRLGSSRRMPERAEKLQRKRFLDFYLKGYQPQILTKRFQ